MYWHFEKWKGETKNKTSQASQQILMNNLFEIPVTFLKGKTFYFQQGFYSLLHINFSYNSVTNSSEMH